MRSFCGRLGVLLPVLAAMALAIVALTGCAAGEEPAAAARAASTVEAHELAEETIEAERAGGSGRERRLGLPSERHEERLAAEEEELEERSNAAAEGQSEDAEAAQAEAETEEEPSEPESEY